MHISEGILSGPVLFSGAALAAAGTAVGLKKIDYDRLPKAGMLSAAFFVASLIHVPIGPSNVHLVLNGIVGLLLGWGAFPSILIALALQAVFFQYGGITTLGVNTIIMALPAVICYLVAGNMLNGRQTRTLVIAFCCGFLSVLMSSILVGCALVFTEEGFLKVSVAVVLAHLPIMVIEGVFTALCVGFLKKVQPSLLPGFTR